MSLPYSWRKIFWHRIFFTIFKIYLRGITQYVFFLCLYPFSSIYLWFFCNIICSSFLLSYIPLVPNHELFLLLGIWLIFSFWISWTMYYPYPYPYIIVNVYAFLMMIHLSVWLQDCRVGTHLALEDTTKPYSKQLYVSNKSESLAHKLCFYKPPYKAIPPYFIQI